MHQRGAHSYAPSGGLTASYDDDMDADFQLPTSTADAPPAAPEKIVQPPEARLYSWARFLESNPFLTHPVTQIVALAFALFVAMVGCYYFVVVLGGNRGMNCRRASFPDYTSTCLLVEVPRTPPARLMYRAISHPTGDDMRGVVLHTTYNGHAVDIEPRTLVENFEALSREVPAQCLCGAMYGLGVSLTAHAGTVYVAPRLETPAASVKSWDTWGVPASEHLGALGYTETAVRAPNIAYYRYSTLSGERHGVQLRGMDAACIALCGDVETWLMNQ